MDARIHPENAVREAGPDDLNALLELYLHLHERAIPRGDNPRLRAAWEKILADEDHHILLCERGGTLAASCVCLIVPNLTRDARPYALIENVVTRSDLRRMGCASACLARAAELARERGCYKIMLMTGSKDPGTLAFYRSCGFSGDEKTAFVRRF